MLKKCIVKCDDNGKPIELVELKTFNDPLALREFQEVCQKNKIAYLKEKQQKAEKERLEKEKVMEMINSLQEQNNALILVIKHLLGLEELKEEQILSILGVEKGESDHE